MFQESDWKPGELKSGDKADTHCTVKGGSVKIAYIMI
jgi:hypothetical protein